MFDNTKWSLTLFTWNQFWLSSTHKKMCIKLNNLRVVMVILCFVPEVNICFCFLLISSLLIGFMQKTSKFEYTNIICTSLDTNFSTFDYCYIKPINRTYKYISFKAKLLKTPVTKIKVCKQLKILIKYDKYFLIVKLRMV